MKTPQSSRRLEEFKELIDAARACVAGDRHWSHVSAAAVALQEAVKMYPVDPRVRSLAEDWARMSVRVWPEWANIEDPISPEEYVDWMREQLRVFDAVPSH